MARQRYSTIHATRGSKQVSRPWSKQTNQTRTRTYAGCVVRGGGFGGGEQTAAENSFQEVGRHRRWLQRNASRSDQISKGMKSCATLATCPDPSRANGRRLRALLRDSRQNGSIFTRRTVECLQQTGNNYLKAFCWIFVNFSREFRYDKRNSRFPS